jgi:hypothetical protein
LHSTDRVDFIEMLERKFTKFDGNLVKIEDNIKKMSLLDELIKR